MKKLVLRSIDTNKPIRTIKLNDECQAQEVFGFYYGGKITIHNAESKVILMKFNVPRSGYTWAIEEDNK